MSRWAKLVCSFGAVTVAISNIGCCKDCFLCNKTECLFSSSESPMIPPPPEGETTLSDVPQPVRMVGEGQ